MTDAPDLVIYVLPTEEGLPPRAVIGEQASGGIRGPLATWSRDSGAWEVGGVPVPDELGEAITDHAKSLGVEW
jgi:hypothetical protein